MKSVPAWIVLALIALVAGLLLGVTNELTKAPIEESNAAAAEQGRREVMPAADSFEQVEAPSGLDSLYKAIAGGEVIGVVSSVTVAGYGGDVEIIVGMDNDGVVTGISVGGADFSETPGLGAKAKDAEFTAQFAGKGFPIALNADVDQITNATITSTAVVDGVNAALEQMKAWMQGG
ncbi:MAG: RnfABCDGE type electron transport complex subunit G [Clostridia bacterium]|nr:RnfABCDGE type electron transport complex subunit G [Clostridia bacterium]